MNTNRYRGRLRCSSDRDLMTQIEEGKREDVKIRDFETLTQELGI